MRRIEGFEKRQRAKPKRSLAHPPAFVRAFQDPPTPLGECRVVLPLPGLRGTHCHAQVSLFCFCGRELASAATVVLCLAGFVGKEITRVGKSAVITGFMRLRGKINGNRSGRKYLAGHQISKVRQGMSCQATAYSKC